VKRNHNATKLRSKRSRHRITPIHTHLGTRVTFSNCFSTTYSQHWNISGTCPRPHQTNESVSGLPVNDEFTSCSASHAPRDGLLQAHSPDAAGETVHHPSPDASRPPSTATPQCVGGRWSWEGSWDPPLVFCPCLGRPPSRKSCYCWRSCRLAES
jgi:hypothetical protein